VGEGIGYKVAVIYFERNWIKIEVGRGEKLEKGKKLGEAKLLC
jgi:hypothetical protein